MSNPSFELILLDADPSHPSPAHRRLARVLKGFLRAHGFRCVSAREITPQTSPAPTPEGTGKMCSKESFGPKMQPLGAEQAGKLLDETGKKFLSFWHSQSTTYEEKTNIKTDPKN